MVNLMKTGQYDVVSASGDASLRLIASGDVEPVNTDLVPNYADVFDGLKMKPWNTVNGVAYGIPHGRGANLLMYSTDVVKPAPTSWGAVFDPASPYKGKVTAYDSPIYIADAALYLMKTKPDLGIKNPYALDDKQFNAAIDLLKTQNAIIGEYWSDYLKAQQAFKHRRHGARHDLADHRQPTSRRTRRRRSRRCCPARARPAGRTPGWWPPRASTRPVPTSGWTTSSARR